MFLSKQILQSARSSAKFDLFGDPIENAHYTRAMLREATSRGHNVMSISKTSSQVMAMLESMVVKEDAERLKASENLLMTNGMKKDYIEDWKESNKDMLQNAGLGTSDLWEEEPVFCSGVFLSMSFSKQVVPFLQDVYQADAAHCNFGKYTLYSCFWYYSELQHCTYCLCHFVWE